MNRHRHLTPEQILSLVHREAGARATIEQAREHLASLCPTCREAMRQARDRLRGAERVPSPEEVEQLLQEFRPLADSVEDLLARLEATTACHTPGAVSWLLREARRELPGRPDRSLAWARAAERALAHADPEPPDALAEAIAYQANAHRAQGDLRTAQALFARVHRLIAGAVLADPMVEADLLNLHATLHLDLHRYEEAENDLVHALELYRQLEQDRSVTETLMQLASLHYRRGSLEAALDLIWTARRTVDPLEDPQLYLQMTHNLALYLAETGEVTRARDILLADLFEPKYWAAIDTFTRLHYYWLFGRLCARTGDGTEAEEWLLKARKGFAARSNPYDTASVSLDLAGLYFDLRQRRKLLGAVKTAVRLFAAQGVHREVYAALLLLQKAAAADTLTAEHLLRVAKYLEEVRHDPSARVVVEN